MFTSIEMPMSRISQPTFFLRRSICSSLAASLSRGGAARRSRRRRKNCSFQRSTRRSSGHASSTPPPRYLPWPSRGHSRLALRRPALHLVRNVGHERHVLFRKHHAVTKGGFKNRGSGIRAGKTYGWPRAVACGREGVSASGCLVRGCAGDCGVLGCWTLVVEIGCAHVARPPTAKCAEGYCRCSRTQPRRSTRDGDAGSRAARRSGADAASTRWCVASAAARRSRSTASTTPASRSFC